jgi:3-dehydroshikimate dehydratase
MMSLGICTMSFPKNTPDEVLGILEGSRVRMVEWSGRDYHLPPSTPENSVRELTRRCASSGLTTPSYGSYFNAYHQPAGDFERVLDVTCALGASTVRIWSGDWDDPGEMGAMSDDQVKRLAGNAAVLADMASRRSVRLAFEYHLHYPTCGAAEVMRVIHESGHPNVHTYFQMLTESRRSVAQNVADLETVWPRLANVHVHYFEEENLLPLNRGAHMWRPLLAKLKSLGYSGPLYLEYYKDYTPEMMNADLAFLEAELATA